MEKVKEVNELNLTTEILDVAVDETELARPLVNEQAEVVLATPFTEAEIETKIKQIELSFRMLRVMKESCLNNIQSIDVLDMNGEPYVQESGFSNFRLAFNIEEKNLRKTIVYKDGSSRLSTDPLSMQGEFDYVLMDGIIRSNLFGVETKVSGGVKVDLDFSTDKAFWLKKAEANWKRRAISNLLGLQKVTWENLPNVKQGRCHPVTHGKTKKADSAKADEIWNNLLRLNQGVVKLAEDMCRDLTGFNGKDGKPVPGEPRPHKLSEVRLSYLVPKVDKLLKQNSHRIGNGSNGNSLKVTNPELDKLFTELRNLYTQDKEVFNTVVTNNGYTNETLKNEVNEFKLEVLIEQIKAKLGNKE